MVLGYLVIILNIPFATMLQLQHSSLFAFLCKEFRKTQYVPNNKYSLPHLRNWYRRLVKTDKLEQYVGIKFFQFQYVGF